MSKKENKTMRERAALQHRLLRECDERLRAAEFKLDKEKRRKNVWITYSMFATLVIFLSILEHLL